MSKPADSQFDLRVDGFYFFVFGPSTHVMDLDGSGVKLSLPIPKKDDPKHNAEAQHSSQTQNETNLASLEHHKENNKQLEESCTSIGSGSTCVGELSVLATKE